VTKLSVENKRSHIFFTFSAATMGLCLRISDWARAW